MKNIFLSLSFFLAAAAAELDIDTPAVEQEVLIPRIQSIHLIGSMSQIGKKSEKSGLNLFGLALPGKIEELEKRLEPFLNREVTEDDIRAMKREIASFYREAGHPFVSVTVPEQTVECETLTLLVMESCVGNICVEETRWNSECKILKWFRTQTGDPLDSQVILKDLQFLNRNPFRQVDVVYTAGKDACTTDVSLVVNDRIPYRVYAGFDNSGVNVLGQNRWFSGFNAAGLWGLDHLFSAQYTSSPHQRTFHAVTVHYTAPLSWRHTLVVYGGYSWLKAPLFFGIDNNGSSAQASLRYEIPLNPSRNFVHEAACGADYKRTNNTLETAGEGTQLISHAVNLFQCQGSYNLGFSTNATELTFLAEAFFSPGHWLPNQSKPDYDELRPGANPLYFYSRSALSFLWKAPYRFEWVSLLRGQFSSGALLPSEQFGLGGYDTVRGYQERTVNADNAIIVNGEMHLPYFSVFRKNKCDKDRFYVLAFFDYALGSNYRRQESEPGSQWLMGAGPGVRWYIGRYITFRGDWGFKLHKDAYPGSKSRFHFSAIASY